LQFTALVNSYGDVSYGSAIRLLQPCCSRASSTDMA
jgi:hypothetical protein